MLLKRLISAAALMAVILPLVWLGGTLYLAAAVAVALLAAWEYAGMLAQAGQRPSRALLFGLAGLLPLEAHLRSQLPALASLLPWPGLLPPTSSLLQDLLTATILLSLIGQVLRQDLRQSLANWSVSLAGGLYIGLPISYFVLLRGLPDGLYWVLLVLLCTWACDTCAFLAGTTFGRHGFFTHISPKKTLEGAIGGIAGGSATALLAIPLLNVPPLHAFALGVAISVASTFGDLAESLIKRQLSAKDSGSTIPGHGGVLDRIDSALFAVVVAYLYASWIS